MLRILRYLTVVSVMLAFTVVAGPAHASPTARAMVQTQRMSGPALTTTQSGWYSQGQVLSLVCYQRGQSVKGYFSPYIAGGWDDLWYKVSDGYWVADVDIDSGSNNPVAPACAASPPAPSGPVVMVNTQRMSGPALTTTQNGWYLKGQVLSLSCYQRGQSVQGYFSPYIPGGWDDLWYKVSDGYWVADVDIDTGSNNPVTPACTAAPTPAPVPAPTSGSTVLTRARSWLDVKVGYNQRQAYANRYGTYRKDCSGFVSMAWGLQPSGMSAPTTGTLPRYAVRISKSQLAPGDILLNTAPGNAGHVAIFVRWANGDHTRYVSWEENGAVGRTFEQTIPYPYLPGNGKFEPYRKK